MFKAHWKKIVKNRSALFAGILAGMASPSSVYADTQYPRLRGSDMERMRQDVARIGGDFSKVIEEENGKEQTTRKSKSIA
jgi:hypothetical protein